MFTLAHALAHIWLGQSALSDVTPIAAPEHEVERWCIAVAAEFLVPLGALRAEYRQRRGAAQCAYASCPALQGKHAYHSPAHPRSWRAHAN